VTRRYEDRDSETIGNTKRRIPDMIGNVIGGVVCAGSPELAALVKDRGGKAESTIQGYGIRAPSYLF
jgi:hypothetical protein